MNHKSISWSHKPKIHETFTFHVKEKILSNVLACFKLCSYTFEFCWLWISPWVKLSWHSCSMWDKPRWLNWFWQFLYEGLSLIWKDSATHMHGLTVYVKEGLPFAWNLSLENCRFLLMFSTGFTSLSVNQLLYLMYGFWLT